MKDEIKSLNPEQVYHNLIESAKKMYPPGPDRDFEIKKINEWYNKKPVDVSKTFPNMEGIGKSKFEETISKIEKVVHINSKSNHGSSIGISAPGTVKIFPKALGEATEKVKKEAIEVINLAHQDIKGYLHKWGILFLASTLVSLGIIVLFGKNYVNRYSQQYISQGKQFAVAQNTIIKNQNESKSKYNNLANNQASFEKSILEQANEIYSIKINLSNTNNENKIKFSSLESSINESKKLSEQDKKELESAINSNFEKFLDSNNNLTKIVNGLSADVEGYKNELSKLTEFRAAIASYDKRIKQITDDIDGKDKKLNELNKLVEKINKENISKKEFESLEKEIKKIKELQEQIDSLKKELDSYKKKQE